MLTDVIVNVLSSFADSATQTHSESKIKRWTDGRLWSPSRILDEFLLYREVGDVECGSEGRTECL